METELKEGALWNKSNWQHMQFEGVCSLNTSTVRWETGSKAGKPRDVEYEAQAQSQRDLALPSRYKARTSSSKLSFDLRSWKMEILIQPSTHK